MIRVAICDDNKVFVNNMSQAVKSEFKRQNNEDIELETYISSELMYQHHLIKPFDLVFLDIDMPEVTGMELAAKLEEQNPQAIVIFISNHEEAVFEAIHYKPFRFIRKAYLQAELSEALQSLKKQKEKRARFITLDVKEQQIVLPVKEIVYIESQAPVSYTHLRAHET